MSEANRQHGHEEQKGALEEKSAYQKPAHKTEREKQSKGEKIGETGWPHLSKFGR